MDNLYYGGERPCFSNAAEGIRFSPDVLGTFLRKIYHGFDTSNDIEPTAWREALRLINEATVEGLSRADVPPTHEEEFYRELRHSNEVFAAFKVHSMGEKMAAKLTTPDGKLKPFRQWAEEVQGISSHYVGSWLRTEYDTAIIRAHTAADWRRFERDKDIMPNLRWMPTTSPEPDSAHRVYWQKKLTLPIDHPFWNRHRPGDRWNCKCTLEQTDEPANPDVLDDIKETPSQKGLENNPGKDGHTFNDTHPYFPKSCAQCPAYRKSGIKNRLLTLFENRKKDCYNCPFIDGCLELANNDGFVRKNEYPNGGKLLIHPNVEKGKTDYHPIVNIGQHFAKQGHIVKITPRVHIKSSEYKTIYGGLMGTKYEGKCPDLQIGKRYYEFEGFVKPWNKKKVGRMLSHGMAQSPYIIIDNSKGGSDRHIRKAIMARMKLSKEIKEVWLYEGGKIRAFYIEGKFI